MASVASAKYGAVEAQRDQADKGGHDDRSSDPRK